MSQTGSQGRSDLSFRMTMKEGKKLSALKYRFVASFSLPTAFISSFPDLSASCHDTEDEDDVCGRRRSHVRAERKWKSTTAAGCPQIEHSATRRCLLPVMRCGVCSRCSAAMQRFALPSFSPKEIKDDSSCRYLAAERKPKKKAATFCLVFQTQFRGSSLQTGKKS